MPVIDNKKDFDKQSHQYHYFFNQSVIGTSLRKIGNNLEGFDDNWHVDKVSENQPKNKTKQKTQIQTTLSFSIELGNK